MDHDAEIIAGQMARADPRVVSQMLDAKRGIACPEPKASAKEVAVDGPDSRLTARCHGRDHDVLHPNEVIHNLACSQSPLRRDDDGSVRTDSLVGAIEDRLQLCDLLFGLVHACRSYRPSQRAATLDAIALRRALAPTSSPRTATDRDGLPSHRDA